MQIQLAKFVIVFPEWYDDRAEWEAESKGWLPGVEVEFLSGARYPITFYDPVRLSQDLEHTSEEGGSVIAETGMAVIPAVTRVGIVKAVETLVAQGFFDHLRPLRDTVANGVVNGTYPLSGAI
ncbi:MAG: hypothetical protein ACRC7O_04605 [Fimbriiglobus sp.]